MPIYKNRTVFEVARGLKAFFKLEAGLTRGQVPEFERLGTTPRISPPSGAMRHRRVNTERVIWLLGSPRTGSTWLGRILGQLENHLVWDEPFFGVVLGLRENMANGGRLDNPNFLLAEDYKDVWLQSMRNMFLDVCEAKFPGIYPNDYLVVKEPNGSFSAPLIMQAFPESKLVFLNRDGRDVVASLLDAASKTSWYGYERYEPSLAEATMQSGGFTLPHHRSEDEFVEQLARNYINSVNAVEKAYFDHPEGSKARTSYESLRENPLKSITDMYKALGIELDERQLDKAIESLSWENIPASEKGEGKFYRKAKPGSWKEDLTERQVKLVERVIGDGRG